MPTLAQIRTRCDNFLAPRWQALLDAQESYRLAHDRYWQGLVTHSALPNHTTASANDVQADALARHPTDQAESWLDFFPLLDGVNVPAALVVDVYEDAQGHGFVATLYVRFNGTVYRRVQAAGHRAAEYAAAWAVYAEES